MKLRILLFLLLVCSTIHAQFTPTRLRTDLVENTDKVWSNGFLSNLTLYEAEESRFDTERALIRSSNPMFSWVIPGAIQGLRQSAYQIVLLERGRPEPGNGEIWSSGKVASATSSVVLPSDVRLSPGKIYHWKVKIWNEAGNESDFSAPKAFRTAGELETYSTPFVPLQKTVDSPVKTVNAGKGRFFYDFGKDAFGQVELTLHSAKGGDTILIHFGEHVSGPFEVDRKPAGTLRYRRVPLVLEKGTHRYAVLFKSDKRNTGSKAIMMPAYIGEVLPFRYLEIELPSESIEIQAVLRHSVFYEFNDDAVTFSSSDSVLNQVWELSKYSIKATSFAGYYVDGDRERIPYEADALINQLSHYTTDVEFNMAKRSLDYLIFHATWPTEWSLQNLLVAWYDYLYSGDIRTAAKRYTDLRAKLLMPLAREDGLISTRTGKQTDAFKESIHYKTFDGKETLVDIVDWPQKGALGLGKQEQGETDGFVFTDYNSVVNAFYFAALNHMADLAEVMGKQEDAKHYRDAAGRVKKSFQAVFVNKRNGLIRDGEGTDHSSLHANMMAFAFGLVPEGNREKVLAHMRSRGMACSVYGSQFLLDGLYNAGEADYALSLMNSTGQRSWYNMLRTGSTITTEAWDTSYKPNQDWNHAWGAAPANVIVKKLMGVEPLAPGFERFSLKPQPGLLESATLNYATLKGEIKVGIENRPNVFTLVVTIPSGVESEVYLPKKFKKSKVLCDGKSIQASDAGQFLKVGTMKSGSYIFEVKLP